MVPGGERLPGKPFSSRMGVILAEAPLLDGRRIDLCVAGRDPAELPVRPVFRLSIGRKGGLPPPRTGGKIERLSDEVERRAPKFGSVEDAMASSRAPALLRTPGAFQRNS